MDTKELMEENEQLKCALKDLIKEKSTLEYLVFKSFTQILNSKKQKIKELEDQIKILKSGNEGGNDNLKPNLNKKVKHFRKDTSSEDECSAKFYEKDTDVEDSDENENNCMLTFKDIPPTPQKVSPAKRYLESSDSLNSKKEDDSETELSQEHSEENYSQYLLKPYSNSISSDENECEKNQPPNEKLNHDVEVAGPSKAKRKKVLEDTTDTDLLEELLGDL